jgi:chorismate-pyruvate lyase
MTQQFARPAHLSDVNVRTLTPFHRALLTLDGTVTKFLEAFTFEPVQVRVLAQDVHALSRAEPWLEAPAGTAVLTREVLLESEGSSTLQALAVSIIVIERAPAGFPRGLDAASKGLGQALANSAMETRREILWFGRERVERLPAEHRGLIGARALLSRTYRVIADGRPLMLINERFPLEDDALPAHH